MEAVTHFSTELSTLASEINEARVLGPTAARKAAATLTAGVCSNFECRLVANQMGHLSDTAEAYYISLGDNDHCIEAYRVMGTLRRKHCQMTDS